MCDAQVPEVLARGALSVSVPPLPLHPTSRGRQLAVLQTQSVKAGAGGFQPGGEGEPEREAFPQDTALLCLYRRKQHRRGRWRQTELGHKATLAL